MERFKLLSAVHLFLIKDNKILLQRRFNTGYEDGNFSVPAGHLDGNESASKAMAREALEETGIIVDPENLRVIHTMHRLTPKDERIDFFLTASEWQGEPVIKEPDKCDDLQWFPINQPPSNTIPYIRFAIKQYEAKNTFSEFGW